MFIKYTYLGLQDKFIFGCKNMKKRKSCHHKQNTETSQNFPVHKGIIRAGEGLWTRVCSDRRNGFRILGRNCSLPTTGDLELDDL